MLSPADFVGTLKSRGIRSFSGVPCSFFQAAINFVLDDRELRYTMVPNEGSALALASGAQMAGTPTAVLIQNSGLGNLINPLTSLNLIYGIPVLLFVSGRAYGVDDEPQHEIIGRSMGEILDAVGVAHEDLPDGKETFARSLEKALEAMRRTGKPFAYFVRQGCLDEYVSARPRLPAGQAGTELFPMKRMDAIRIAADLLTGDEYVVVTTGKPSRELFAVKDRARNFYMQGSMGHAAAIGLGVAREHPEKKVVVLDGDGALLMHLGILSSIGHYAPANLLHVVLDNESYETTGDQDTTSKTTDFCAMARAAGYNEAVSVSTADELKKKFAELSAKPGPNFLRVKINRLPTTGIPRITSRHTSVAIAETFRKELVR